MNNKLLQLTLIIISAFVLSACESSVERTLENGNQAYSQGAFEEALVDYSEAMEKEPALAEPVYNLANTFYRLGAFEEAGGFLSRAIETASNELAEHGLYNLGNNLFQQQQMESAIEAYKEALRMDPHDLDAKYNLELAMLQQEQQQQQEQQEDQQQEQKEQQEEQEQSDQSDQGQSEDNQGEQDQSEQGQGEENSEQNESGQEEETGQENNDQQQDGSPQDSNTSDGTPQEEQNEDGSGQPQQIEGLTEEQARQLLAAIGQTTETLQEKLEEIYGFIGQPPAKDW